MFLLVCSCVVSAASAGALLEHKAVEVKDGWMYVNGEKFFVKGVGYEGWRPGQTPARQDLVDLALVDHDFKMIKEAGFNTIRTAGGLTPEMISLAKKYGLMVMHGVWFDKNINYSRPESLEYATGLVKENVAWANKFDNILTYLVANELPVQNVLRSGSPETTEFFRKIMACVRSVDIRKPVAMADWIPTAFLDHSFWDIVCFNAYIYSPTSIMYAMGYEQYIEWLKTNVARDKPLIITEFGASVSKSSVGAAEPGYFRYGGNSLQEQSLAVIKMYDDIVEAGAQGACVHEWIDAWWRPGNPEGHEDDPEEWFGILGMDEPGLGPKGNPRPAYYALKEYNQAIVVEPKKTKFYQNTVPVEVYATENATRLMARVNAQPWFDLKKEGRFWWKANVDAGKLADGKHVFEIQAFQADQMLVTKKQSLWVSKDKDHAGLWTIRMALDKPSCNVNEKMKITIKVADHKGNGIPGQKIYYSFFQPDEWQESKASILTGDGGEAVVEYVQARPGVVVMAAGVKYQLGQLEKQAGDIKIVVVNGHEMGMLGSD